MAPLQVETAQLERRRDYFSALLRADDFSSSEPDGIGEA